MPQEPAAFMGMYRKGRTFAPSSSALRRLLQPRTTAPSSTSWRKWRYCGLPDTERLFAGGGWVPRSNPDSRAERVARPHDESLQTFLAILLAILPCLLLIV